MAEKQKTAGEEEKAFEHEDPFTTLNQNLPLREKLRAAHASLQQIFPEIARVAIALYDPQTAVLKTYIDSSGEDNPLHNYQALIDDAPSLQKILEEGRPRVINNMVTFEDGQHEHTQRIGRQGYAASYTMPMFYNGAFFGFLFFNSYKTDIFTPENLNHLDMFGHMISLLVINELTTVRTLTAALTSANKLSHLRDPETGSHLDRMSRFARVIAAQLATELDLEDEYIEHVFAFSPLHDIGKLAIPEAILLKPDKLTEEEESVMRTHAEKGRELLDEILNDFGLKGLNQADVLRNIAQFHHETMDGSGYPEGLRGDNIPLEARIVAVADIFDALTSARPYKDPWSNKEACAALMRMAGEKLDRDCVQALLDNIEQIESIQQHFRENEFG